MCAINMMVANGFQQTDHTGGIVLISLKGDTRGVGRLPTVLRPVAVPQQNCPGSKTEYHYDSRG